MIIQNITTALTVKTGESTDLLSIATVHRRTSPYPAAMISGSVDSRSSTRFASNFFSHRGLDSTLRWGSVDQRLVSGCQGSFSTCCSTWQPIHFDLAMDDFAYYEMEEQQQRFFVSVTVFVRKQTEKRAVQKTPTTSRQETTPNSWFQTVEATHTGGRQISLQFTHQL